MADVLGEEWNEHEARYGEERGEHCLPVAETLEDNSVDNQSDDGADLFRV
jgi:hypothetical protein